MADIWDNLNTTKLGDEPGSVINTQTRNIHLEKRNRELLEDVNLINQAVFRGDGGVIPGTGVIKSVDVTDNTRTTLFTPSAGETYVLHSISADVTNVGGTCTYTFFMSDGTTLVRWFYYQSAGASPVVQSDADFPDMRM